MNAVNLNEAFVTDLIQQAFIYALPERKEKMERLNLQSTIHDLGIQSVAALEMAGFIEDRLNVQFSDDELAAINKLEDFATLIFKYS